ncbi:hypothetical protein SORBI_3008G133200 [Sorghum bicolor]|uniref:GDSL esterase/lipase n=1 Tax=Sorghum bicolor TaxID=4558 RepID=A0A1Z5R6D7_SORBI|nr:hypothetical protein SORBI_3008G133200 [Sorghum bicolor]
MAAIRPAGAAGSAATAAVAGALLALLGLLAAAALCSGSSAAGGDEAELIVSTAGAGSMGTTTRQQVMVPAMYVFGDSLVDAGNNDFLPAPAPKAVPPNGVDLPRTISRRTGRFTNGYNLADIIAQHVGFGKSPPAYLSLTPLSRQLDLLRGRVGTNYASGGSGILDVTVALFAKTKARILRAGLVSRERLDGLLGRSLFVISTGGNDFGAFDGPGGVPMSQAPEFMAGMVDDYLKYINVLYKLGARKLVLLDVLPVGCLPSQRATTADGECDGDGNYLSELFNALLRAEMAKAAAAMPAMRYSIASLYNVLTDMIANPARAGLREVKTACCGSGRFNGEVECSVETNLCADRGEYLFWDTVHGTQAAYRRAVRTFFYGTTTREAEPISLHQLLQDQDTEQHSTATAEYTSV